MAIRTVITPENPILRRRARKVTVFDGRLQQFIDDMAETMVAAPGVGLAAPQVAVSQRVIVVRLPDDTEEDGEAYGDSAGVLYAIVNPEIARASREMVDGAEGCLSVPGYLGTVNRHQSVTVKGQDRHGKKMRIKAEGWLARVFQHEIDHLSGVLFIDIASEVWPIQESGTIEGPEALEAANQGTSTVL